MAQRPLRSPRPADDDSEFSPPTLEPLPPAAPPAPVMPIHPRKRPSQTPSARRRRDLSREPKSALWYGDNLDVLREHIKDETVDLVYLDPPFNSNRAYNVIFRGPEGTGASAQIQAFDDTWSWSDATNVALDDLMRTAPLRVQSIIDALVHALDRNDMSAYLVMMALRLVELHRKMKPTATLYLHCDPTASHYLKVVLDSIFGKEGFLSEVVWKRTGTHSSAKRWGPVHDVILCYAKEPGRHTWNRPYVPLDAGHLKRHYRRVDSDGRRYEHGELTGPGVRRGRSGLPWRGFDVTAIGRHWTTTVDKLDELDAAGRIYLPADGGWPRLIRYEDESKGRALGDVWTDVPPINMQAKERLGYPTQKPLALLRRLVEASSNPGDLVLDPFCGCGTAVVASEELGRRWIGIDITSLAIGVIEARLDVLFEGADFAVEGLPKDLNDATDLARRDPFQFQWWAAGRVGAIPHDGRNKRGPDGGIDGIIPFSDDASGKRKRCIISVKSGRNVSSEDVRALLGTVNENRAETGVLITLEPPTTPMKLAASRAGSYLSPLGHPYPKIQILTVEDILADKIPNLPDQESQRRRRRRIATQHGEQQRLPDWP